MPLALYIVLSVIVLWIVCGGYVFWAACRRKKGISWLDETAVEKTQFRDYIPMIRESDRWLKEHGAQDVYMENREGLQLHALWVPNPSAMGTVILVHGYQSTPLVDAGPAFEGYFKKGFNLLLPTQRANGKSEGKWITFGIKESGDLIEWVLFHNRTFGSYPVLLSGLSMGASTVLYTLDQELPENVKAAVADCGFSSPRSIISSVFTRVTHMPAWLFMWSCEWFARIFGGFSLQEKDTNDVLKKNRLPLLMVHGKDDHYVPCEMTERAYSGCTGSKRLLLVEGAGHGLSYLVDNATYSEMIDALLRDAGFIC